MCSWLEEACQDFRVGKEWLIKLRFAVFGLGDSLYEEKYNLVAKKLNKWLLSLDGRSICRLGLADSSISRNDMGTSEIDFQYWLKNEFLTSLTKYFTEGDQPSITSQPTKIAAANDDEYEYDDEDVQIEPVEDDRQSDILSVNESEISEESGEKVLDLEDLGNMLQKQNINKDELKQKQGLDINQNKNKKIKNKNKGPLPLKEMRRRNRQIAAAKEKREIIKEKESIKD